MKIIKANILKKPNRKYWYIRYQKEENGNITTHEVSSKVYTDEKSREYMKTIFLPAWCKKKEGEKEKSHSTTLDYYANIHIESSEKYRDFYSMKKRAEKIIQDFGDKEISEITELEIELWINKLKHHQTGKELTIDSRKKYKTSFNKIFTFAKKDNAIEINFIENIVISGKPKNKKATKTFTAKEVNLLLEKSKDIKYGELLHPYLGLVFNLGLSPSEAIALQVNDIQFASDGDTKIISINKGISKNVEGATKNEYRERDIILRKQAIEYLDILLKLAMSRSTPWLFSNKDGSRLKGIEDIRGTRELRNSATGKLVHSNSKWYKLLEDLNLDYRPLKNCRHTFTMAMIELPESSITSIANTLGHSSTHMIINHYAKDISGKAMEINGDLILY